MFHFPMPIAFSKGITEASLFSTAHPSAYLWGCAKIQVTVADSLVVDKLWINSHCLFSFGWSSLITTQWSPDKFAQSLDTSKKLHATNRVIFQNSESVLLLIWIFFSGSSLPWVGIKLKFLSWAHEAQAQLLPFSQVKHLADLMTCQTLSFLQLF